MHADGTIPQIISDLYEGALEDEAWCRAITGIVELTGAVGAHLVCVDPSTNTVLRDEAHRVDPGLIAAYRAHWSTEDILIEPFVNGPVGRPRADYQLTPLAVWERSAIYNELAVPYDTPYILATLLHSSPDRFVALSLKTSRRHGPFSAEELRRMARVVPHLRRALTIRDRLAQAETRAHGLFDTMDRLPFGVLLLGDDLEIREASTCARALLAARDGLHADRGKLGFIRSSDERAFWARLREDPTRAQLDDALVIARSASREAFKLLLLPLAPTQQTWLGPTSRWLVLILDPETAPRPAARDLQRALGITPAEAALAQELARGLSVTEAADLLEISPHTARSQLKSIFSKTGLNTQSKLVSRILSIYALPRFADRR